MSFGNKLRELRRQNGLTQLELAEKVKLSTANISKYENGTLEPSLDTLVAISSALNASIDFLLGIKISPDSSSGTSYAMPKISRELAAITKYYNELSENGKEKAFEYIEMLKEREIQKEKQND